MLVADVVFDPTSSARDNAADPTDPTDACDPEFADACGHVGSLVTPSDSSFVLGPTVPGRWGLGPIGTGATITYSFAVGDGYRTGETNSDARVVPLDTFIPFSREAIEAEVRHAFDAWEAVADLTFVEVPDDGARFDSLFTTSGDIRIGGHAFDGPGGALAHGFFPPSFLKTAPGDIHFDTADDWTIGFEGDGFDIFQVMAHEIGHAIGLNHTTTPGSLMNAHYSEAFRGPQASDIAGAVYLYGPPATVPEPASFALFAAGSLLLAIRQRSRSLHHAPAQRTNA